MSQLPSSTVAAAFVTPRFAAQFATMVGLDPDDVSAESATTTPRPTVVAVVKDPLGLYLETPAPAAVAPVILGSVAVAMPSLLAARRASNESTAIGGLRTIGSAQATHYARHGRFGTLAELVAMNALDAGWTDGVVRDGYRFRQVAIGGEKFEFKAEPLSAADGTRSFNIVEDFVIREAEGLVAPSALKGIPIGSVRGKWPIAPEAPTSTSPASAATRKISNEAAAMKNLRTLGSAEAEYYTRHGRFAPIALLVSDGLLTDEWRNGIEIGQYRITEGEIAGDEFEFRVEPIAPEAGNRAFNMIEDFVIRSTPGIKAPTGDVGTPIGSPAEEETRQGPPSPR